MIFGAAIQGHRQNTGNGGFTDATVPTENVAMRDALLFDGVLERAGDVVLPNDVREFLWPVFAGKDLIAHGNFDYKLAKSY
jgi:hypothetical protein